MASVIIKLVSSPDEDPKEQLKMITSNLDSTILKGQARINRTYDNILVQASKAISMDKTVFYDNFQLVVRSIIIVFNPLSCETMAAILNMKVENVRTALC
jgi:ATP-dependent Clp protease ATP-binding subunit ClpA